MSEQGVPKRDGSGKGQRLNRGRGGCDKPSDKNARGGGCDGSRRRFRGGRNQD